MIGQRTPAVGLGFTGNSCTNRVQIDLSQAVDQGLAVVHDHALESIGPEKPLSFVPSVVISRKALLYLLYILVSQDRLTPAKLVHDEIGWGRKAFCGEGSLFLFRQKASPAIQAISISLGLRELCVRIMFFVLTPRRSGATRKQLEHLIACRSTLLQGELGRLEEGWKAQRI